MYKPVHVIETRVWGRLVGAVAQPVHGCSELLADSLAQSGITGDGHADPVLFSQVLYTQSNITHTSSGLYQVGEMAFHPPEIKQTTDQKCNADQARNYPHRVWRALLVAQQRPAKTVYHARHRVQRK